MTRYVIIRLAQGIIALIVASLVVFLLARLSGDPLTILLPPEARAQDYQAMARLLGLDKPLYEQYWAFLTNAIRGDLGSSIFFRKPVVEIILSRLPASLILVGAAFGISLLISLPVGVMAAVRRDRWPDFIAKAVAILGQSMPTFWLAILLIQIFSVNLRWLPSAGYAGIPTIILPAFALGYHVTAGILRLTRSAMLDVLGSDFVRLARIKGLPERAVIWKHALRNTLIPVVTFSGMLFVRMLAGSVVVETIFAWPGLGQLAYQSVVNRDFPLEQGLILVFTAFFIVFNLLVDILYVYLDPRIRYVKV